MSDSTLKQDVLAALDKELARLNAMKNRSSADAERRRVCLEFIAEIKRGDKTNAAILKIEREMPTGPLRL
jgi:hypothetical protein